MIDGELSSIRSRTNANDTMVGEALSSLTMLDALLLPYTRVTSALALFIATNEGCKLRVLKVLRYCILPVVDILADWDCVLR